MPPGMHASPWWVAAAQTACTWGQGSPQRSFTDCHSATRQPLNEGREKRAPPPYVPFSWPSAQTRPCAHPLRALESSL